MESTDAGHGPARSRRAGTALLTWAGLLLAAALAGGQTSAPQTRPAGTTAPTTALAVTRGGSLAFDAAGMTLAFATAHGKLQLSPADLAVIELEGKGELLHQAVFGNGSVLGGLLEGDKLSLKVAGRTVETPIRGLVRLTFPPAGEAAQWRVALTLKNGDSLRGAIADATWSIRRAADGLTVAIHTDQILSAEFGESGATSLAMAGGEAMRGQFAQEYVRFQIQPGPELKIPVGDLARLGGGPPPAAWVDIAKELTAELAKTKPPGLHAPTAGVGVDRATGDVYMVVPDQGVWKSVDKGGHWDRVDGETVLGRCETGHSICLDPEGGRLAVAGYDGASGMTADGKAWRRIFEGERNLWCVAVDWGDPQANTVIALAVDPDNKPNAPARLLYSADGGKTSRVLGEGYLAAGLFDADTIVAVKDGQMQRSTDTGATWRAVGDATACGRTFQVFKGVGYWATAQGVLMSKDKGATWQRMGSAIECTYGPRIGADSAHMVVGNAKGLYATADGGKTWDLATPWPEGMTGFLNTLTAQFSPTPEGQADWLLTFGWDWRGDILYASMLSQSTFQYRRPRAPTPAAPAAHPTTKPASSPLSLEGRG